MILGRLRHLFERGEALGIQQGELLLICGDLLHQKHRISREDHSKVRVTGSRKDRSGLRLVGVRTKKGTPIFLLCKLLVPDGRPLEHIYVLCLGVDGDSASATEIYALLSSLAGLPVRQDIAVTGSLNQKGDVQPIGGVNEKVEGFFDCVRSGRPTGSEGVIIPQQNVNDLMLRDDVVAAVAKGKFHIYAIDKIEQGIEILTGAPVGRRRKDGSYTPDSIFARVDSRLDEIAQGLRRFSDSEG